MIDEYKPSKLAILWASLKHDFLWKFSKRYRTAIRLMWSVNPDRNEFGSITISHYGCAIHDSKSLPINGLTEDTESNNSTCPTHE